MATDITHRPEQQQFVAEQDGRAVGRVDYRRDGEVLAVLSTHTDPAFRGQGIAAEVTRALLAYAEEAGLRVRPVCPYTVDFLDTHPEYAALRA